MFNLSTGEGELGYLGQYSKRTEIGTGFHPLIDMGARPYHIQLGRFLTTDPIEGGGMDEDSTFGYTEYELKRAADESCPINRRSLISDSG
ncbi:MAG: hypothetical protein HYZ59_03245 [Actinobacteria bacterium]|nr:hypothetical protein [Actinomycetota bacterium]